MKHDLVGRKFGRLTVLKDSQERYRDRNIVWLCKCECGEKAYVTTHNLMIGNTRSCGCLRRELARERRLKK